MVDPPYCSYTIAVRYDWNPAKCASNITKHGLDFAEVHDFEWATALVGADTRHDYGEVRLAALGVIGGRVHVLVYTIRRVTWVISLRKAKNWEIRRYEGED